MIEKVPFFSVAIPVYNGEDCIERCVESVFSQTFSDVEVVVVNDGSSDRTAEILEGMKKRDSRLKVINVENGGVFRARALGIANCTGTYMTFCDDDDVMQDKRALEKFYEKLKDEKTDLLQYGYVKKFNHIKVKSNTVKREVFVDGEEFYEREYPFLLSSRNISSRLFVNTCTKMYHKRLRENAPSPDLLERMFMGDDMVLNLFLLRNCRSAIYVTDAPYLSYRLAGSSSHFRKDEMKNLDLVKRYQSEFLKDWHGKDKAEVVRLHHLEVAQWLFAYTVESINAQGKEETEKSLAEILTLPAFVRAAEYFSDCNYESECVKLLVEGNVQAYISAAEKYKVPLKKSVFAKIKNILYRI